MSRQAFSAHGGEPGGREKRTRSWLGEQRGSYFGSGVLLSIEGQILIGWLFE